MRYLIDSHILFWSVFEIQKLSGRYSSVLGNQNNTVYVSVVSFWELAIKQSLGKLSMPDDFPARMEQTNAVLLPLSLAHIRRISTLPHHHSDPFDRMLVAQAEAEGLTLLTDDREMRLYGDVVALL